MTTPPIPRPHSTRKLVDSTYNEQPTVTLEDATHCQRCGAGRANRIPKGDGYKCQACGRGW